MNYSRRLRALRRSMNQQRIEALIITHLPDVRYLCGFTGSNAALCVTATRAGLFTDGRYTLQAKEQTQSARVVISEKSALGDACAWLAKSGARHAHFDPEHVTVAALQTMRGSIDKRRRNFFTSWETPLVSTLRLSKDEDELKLIAKAARLGCELFEEILPTIQSGVAETAIAAQLEFAARSRG